MRRILISITYVLTENFQTHLVVLRHQKWLIILLINFFKSATGRDSVERERER